MAKTKFSAKALHAKASLAGLTKDQIQLLIDKLGLQVATVIIHLLENNTLTTGKSTATITINDLVVQLLQTYKTVIEAAVENGEGMLFDALVALTAGQAPLLAAALEAFKSKFIAAADTATNQLFDQLIAILKAQ